MKTKYTKYLILAFFIITGTISCAQQPIQVNIDNKKYIIPDFKEDSVQSFNNDLVKDKVISSIKDSRNEIEIRLYIINMFDGNPSVWTICSTDSGMHIQESKIVRSKYNHYGDYDKVGKDNYGNYFYKRIINKKANLTTDTILVTFIANKLFNMADQTHLLKTFRKKNIKLIDPCEGTTDCGDVFLLCEIKFGNKFRNFRMLGTNYFSTNHNIKEFEYPHNILNVFYRLFRKIV